MGRVKKKQKTLVFEELEPRLLFSADMGEALVADAVIEEYGEEPAVVVDINSEVEVHSETSDKPGEEDVTATEAQAEQADSEQSNTVMDSTLAATQEENVVADTTDNSQSKELVFVNDNVTDYQQLVDDLLQEDPGRDIEVVILDDELDGFDQVTETLHGRDDLDAIHFLTHGSDAQINLGDSWLNNSTLQANSDDVAGWGNALTETGDILFYGCNIAVDNNGQALLDNIADLTGADIAGSDDITGHISVGGDWDLEANTGEVESGIAVSDTVQRDWVGALDITNGLAGHWSFDTDASDGSGNNYNGTFIDTATIDTTSATNNLGSGKLTLDGTSDSVDLSAYVTNFSSLSEGTISAWVNTTAIGQNAIFSLADSSTDNVFLGLGINDGNLVYRVRDGGTTHLSVEGSVVLNDGDWHHVLMTVDGTGNSFYVDGMQLTEANGRLSYSTGDSNSQVFFDQVPNPDSVSIGALESAADPYSWEFDGLIDDVRVYNRALSATDITELHAYTGADNMSTFVSDGTVSNEQKISDTSGGLTAVLDNEDAFGNSVAQIGDLDGDGINDIAVGALADDDGGTDRGAVHILFLNADGSVKAEQKISDTTGGLSSALADDDWFGNSVAGLGDLDGDGINDMAVGAYHDDDGGTDRGAVHILFLNADGTVKAEQKISDTEGGLTAALSDSSFFGVSVASMGDLDGDGINDIAVGAHADDDGGTNRGAVHILFLNSDGTVKAEQKISDTVGGLSAALSDSDLFGASVASIGDLDGDGVNDIAVGAIEDDDGGTDRGAVHILFLNADGTVRAEQKISNTTGGLTAVLDDVDRFGRSMAGVGDLDGDGIGDLAVGAYYDDDGGTDRGAVQMLFLNSDGTVKAEQKISDITGGLDTALDDGDGFGIGVAAIGDINGDGVVDLAVAAYHDDDGGTDRGAVYVLNLTKINTAPILTSLDGGPTFVEDAAGVVLDADVDASDDELDALNLSLGNYDGVSLTLIRNGGVSADDIFSFSDGNGITLSGSNLIKNSLIIASFDITTTSGELVINFTDVYGEIPNSTDIDNILQQITYSNSSHTPPAAIQIDWTFDDGNTGSQGSGGALTAIGSTTVNITAVNDAPTAANNSVTTNEYTTYTFTATDFNFSDVDVDALVSIKITSLETVGRLQLSGSDVSLDQIIVSADIPNLTYAPVVDANVAGYDSFQFTVNDGTVDSVAAYTMTVDVTSVNDVPLATNDSYTTNENTAVTTGNVLTNDDLGDAPTSITAFDATSIGGGTVIHNGNGTFTYSPALNFNGNDTFTYTITDNDSETSTAMVTITVNAAPTTSGIGDVTVDEDAASTVIDLFAAFADTENGDANLTYTITSNTNQGLFSTTPIATDNVAGTLTLDYAPGAYGTATITVQATDTGGATVESSFLVTVHSTNVAPVAADDSTYTVNEDSTLVVDWWDTAWTQRQELTFNNAAQAVNLTDFPVLIKLNSSNIDYTQTQDNGEDLRFFDADGTALAHEVEGWNESADPDVYSYVWVKVPLINSGSTTDSITMYYGNAAAADAQDSTSVWSASFEAVYHLNDDFLDSTASTNDGTNVGSISSTGQIADGQLFDGADDDVTLGSDTSLDDIFAGGATVSAWINPSSWGENGYGRILDKSGATLPGTGWALELASGAQSLLFQQGFSGGVTSWQSATGSIQLDTWQHVSVTYDSSNPGNVPTFYINGIEVGRSIDGSTPTGTALSDAGLDLHVGNHAMDTVRTFAGSIDDVRLSSEISSADWIRAQYLSTSNSFVSFGGAETAPAMGGLLTNDSDGDSDPLSATLVDDVSHGSLILNTDGSFTYTPDANWHGPDSFTYTANDGSVDSNLATVTITVNPANDAPNLTLLSHNPTFTEGDAAVRLFDSVTADTIESGQTIEELIFTVTNVTDGSNELITLDGSTFILADLIAGTTATNGYGYLVNLTGTTATVTLTTTGATILETANLGGSLSYVNSSENPTTSDRVFTFTSITDSGGTTHGGSDTSSLNLVSTVTVVAANDAPVMDLDADNSSNAAGTDFTTIFIEDGGPVALADIFDASLSDPDSENLTSLTVTIANPLDGANEWLAADTTGTAITASYDSDTGALSLSGADSVDHYQQVLRSLTYDNSSQAPNTVARVITFVANDGIENSSAVTWTAPASQGLVGYWNLNEGTGSQAFDLSGNGNHATLTNMDPATGWVEGYTGQALNFDGTDDYVEIPYSDDLKLDGDFTITLWNKPDSVDTRTRRVAEYGKGQWGTGGDGWLINQYGDDLYWYHQSSGPSSGATNVFTVGQWTHIAISRSGDTFTLYVDGIQRDQDTKTGVVTGNHSLYFGSDAGTQEFDGTLDDVRIYDRALNAGEIEAVYQDHGTTTEVNMVAVNDAPAVITNTGVTVQEGSTGNIITTTMLNEGDVDDAGTGLTYTVTNVTDNGTLSLSGFGVLDLDDTFTQSDIDAGLVAYEHNGSETTTDSFTFSLADGGENGAVSAVGTFTFTVSTSNDAPILTTNNPLSIPEGGSRIITSAHLAVTDADNTADQIIYTVTQLPGGTHSVRLNDSSLGLGETFTQDDIDNNRVTFRMEEEASVTSFKFTVTDGSTTIAEATFSVNGMPVNDAPVVTAPSSALLATEQVGLSIQGTGFGVTDVDAGAGEAAASISVGEGVLTIVEGDSGVTIDAGNGTGTVTFTGTISQINNLLVGSTTGTITYLNSSDNPGASTTITVVVNDKGNTGSDPGLSGDAISEEGTASQTINITSINDSPIIGNAIFALDENSANSTAVGNVPVTDPDTADTHVYTITSGNTGGAFAINNSGDITVANSLALDYETTPTFTLTVQVQDQNGAGFTDTAAITVNLTDVIETANYTIDTITAATVAENAAFTSVTPSISGATPIGNVTYSLAGTDAALFTVDAGTGVVSMVARNYETPADSGGDNIYDLTLIATDGDGNTDSEAFTVTVNDVVEGATYTINAITDTSVDENTVFTSVTPALTGTPVGSVTYSLAGTDAALFSVDTNSGVVSMVARDYETPADSGGDNIYDLTLIATDDDGNTDSEDFTVTVNDVVEGATYTINAIADTSVAENTVFTSITPALTGTPVGSVTYSLAGTDAALFSVDANSGVVSMVARDYETPADSGGDNIYDLTLAATDDDGKTDSEDFTVTVNDVVEGASYTIDSIADTNVDENVAFTSIAPALTGSPIGNVTYTLTGTDAGSFTVDSSTGVVSMIARDYEVPADNNSDNIYEATLVATDEDGNSDSEDVTVTVSDVDFAPMIAGDDTGNVTEDIDPDTDALLETVGTLTIADPDGGESRFIAGTLSGSYGNLTIDPAGNWSYEADNNQAAIQQLDITASVTDTFAVISADGTTHNVVITINGANEAAVNDNNGIDTDHGTDPDSEKEDVTPDEVIGGVDDLIDPGANSSEEDTVDTPDITVDDFDSTPSGDQKPSGEETEQEDSTPLPEDPSETYDADDDVVQENVSQASEDQNSNSNSSRNSNTQIQEKNFSRTLLKQGFKVPAKETWDFSNTTVSAPIFQQSMDSDEAILEKKAIRTDLDTMRQEMDQDFEESEVENKISTYIASGVTFSFSAGVASYLLRAGSMMSSFLATVPLWKGFDPIAILVGPNKKKKKEEKIIQENVGHKDPVSDQNVESMFSGEEKR